MPKSSSCITANCSGDPNVPGAAGGRCPRCYQRKRRGLPPRSSPAYRADGATAGVEIKTVLEPKIATATLRAARAGGISTSGWIRSLILAALGWPQSGVEPSRRKKSKRLEDLEQAEGMR